MLISSIIKRTLNTRQSELNIVISNCEDPSFVIFLEERVFTAGSNILFFDSFLTANTPIDLVICNSRITQFEKCFNLSGFFQCPMLIIDHDHPSALVDTKIKTERVICPHLIYLARSKDIYDSWGQYHDVILDYEFYNRDNTNEWQNLIYKLSKTNFQMSNSSGVNENVL